MDLMRRARLQKGPMTLHAEGRSWTTNLKPGCKIKKNWGALSDFLGLQVEQVLRLTALSVSSLLITRLSESGRPPPLERDAAQPRRAAGQRGYKRRVQGQQPGLSGAGTDAEAQNSAVPAEELLMAQGKGCDAGAQVPLEEQSTHGGFGKDGGVGPSAKRRRTQPPPAAEVCGRESLHSHARR